MSENVPFAPVPQDSEIPGPPAEAAPQPSGTAASLDRVSVTAFVFSLLGAGLVAIPLAVWGLVRTRPGPRRGRGFAIAALCVSAAWAVASVALLSSGLLGSPSDTAGTDASRVPPAGNVTAPSAPTTPTSKAAQTHVAAQPTGPLAKPKRLYWQALKPAMCVRFPQNPAVNYVTVVDCRVSHDEEVMVKTVLPGPKNWPGDSAVQTAADARCGHAFTAYVGISFDDSRLEIDSVTADAAGWKAGDHTLICFVLDPANGHLTRALRGIGQ